WYVTKPVGWKPSGLVGFSLAVIISLGFVSPAQTYERDVHLSVTAWLLELAGFQQDEAYEIAKFDQAVDDNPNMQPLWDLSGTGVRRRELYHFVNGSRLEDLKQNAYRCFPGKMTAKNYRDIGTFLHAKEDRYAHKDYDARLGH